MRLIDADALKIPSEEMIAKMIINSAPSIDIVFCKECKHWQTDWNPEESAENLHYCAVVDGCRFGDFFCADGEREGE